MAREYDTGFEAGPVGYERSYLDERRQGYGREPVGYGADYEPFGGSDADWPGAASRRRRLLARRDWRFRGGPGGAGAWREGGWREPARREGGPYRGFPGTGAPARDVRPGRTFRGYERREPWGAGERHFHDVPPDYRRYLSEDEYGLGPGRAYDREFEEDRFRRGPLGPRNALFGGEGFVRYDADFDEEWW